jgi:hypothetical protein
VAVDTRIVCKVVLYSTNNVTAYLEDCQIAGAKYEGDTVMKGLPIYCSYVGVTRAKVASCLRGG